MYANGQAYATETNTKASVVQVTNAWRNAAGKFGDGGRYHIIIIIMVSGGAC